MIKVARLQGKEFFINPDMIEFAEETPDLVLSLISGKKVVVGGSVEELVQKIVDYRMRTHVPLPEVVKRHFDDSDEPTIALGQRNT
ncbi:MAG: flagellar FlbD family protein [Oscillospiraceae bacterium]|jgi:flagellar protein FlbD|nr:flagellar FlbD family protein [Oscillospiraceae bacterium]